MIESASQNKESTVDAHRLLLIQNGARHNYSIPLAFQRRDALAGVYTDLVSTKGVGTLLTRFAEAEGELGKILQRRSPPPELADHISAFGSVYLAKRLASKLFSAKHVSRIERTITEKLMMIQGTQGATHIYSMFGEGGAFVELAKSQGLKIIGDVYIALSSDQIVAEEAVAHSDWAEDIPPMTSPQERIEMNRVLIHQSDLLVCPSEFVRNDLLSLGVNPRRAIIAPYAVSPKWTSLKVTPEPGRILFAGSAILRKGIHILAGSATQLKGRCRFRVAGSVSDKIRNHPDAEALEFLGHLGPTEMAEEFSRADVFAFPSLAEGSAGVTAEALGAGIPVVTTMESGSIVRDRVEGRIIQSRDSDSLSAAILDIVEDRAVRESMSHSARERAKAFTWDGFAGKILSSLSDPLVMGEEFG